jgi:hypothetical protein
MMGSSMKAQHRRPTKPCPTSLSQGQRSDTICRATSDLGGRLAYLDRWLRLALPKVPSATTPRQGGPGGELQHGASSPAPPGTCRSSRASGSTLSGGQDVMRFSPAWEADYSDVPSSE